MNAVQRMKEPTPPFFKKLRNIGLVIASAGTAIVAAPVVLPTAVIKMAGYLVVAGGVASAVSQAVTGGEQLKTAAYGNKRKP